MKVVLQKGDRIGPGGYGKAYRATEPNSKRDVALKISRASLGIRRPMLQHEARVLKLLSGHSGIPEIYGYSRVKHFKMLSMHRYGRTTTDEDNITETDFMTYIAALEHIHIRGLVHRDIKPNNILFQAPDSWKVCLIDFGLTYPAPSVTQVAESCSSSLSELTTVFGTLFYFIPLSYNMMTLPCLKLTCRDDLESLAYTLLFLLRGSPPW
ncbi:kinase-like domain-containing protein, partial [Rhizoctonia solani]